MFEALQLYHNSQMKWKFSRIPESKCRLCIYRQCKINLSLFLLSLENGLACMWMVVANSADI